MFKGGTPRPSQVTQTQVRVATKTLIQAIDSLTKEQREWVKQSGFGDLLDFTITIISHDVACKLLWMVNTNELAIKLDEKPIQISEADVERVLGFPRGSRPVTLSNNGIEVRCWQNEFKNILPSRIRQSDILNKIITERTASNYFKKNFLLVVANTMISPSKDSNANMNLAYFSGDWDSLYEYNWCAYVLNNLKKSIEIWKPEPEKFFTGPLLFIVVSIAIFPLQFK